MNMVLATLLALAPTLVLLLTVSGLISAAETSMTAASRGRMHQLERDGDRAAQRVNRLISDQENMIGAILLSNNVLNIFASALTTAVLNFRMGAGGRAAQGFNAHACTRCTRLQVLKNFHSTGKSAFRAAALADGPSQPRFNGRCG